jgi:hypothetical protein
MEDWFPSRVSGKTRLGGPDKFFLFASSPCQPLQMSGVVESNACFQRGYIAASQLQQACCCDREKRKEKKQRPKITSWDNPPPCTCRRATVRASYPLSRHKNLSGCATYWSETISIFSSRQTQLQDQIKPLIAV